MSAPLLQSGLGVDAEHPWPGLLPFAEVQSAYFFGRQEQIDELFRLIQRETLTVLFGQSGLGKTSLLQAGLFPKLRRAAYLPIYLRLEFFAHEPPLRQRVWQALQRGFDDQQVAALARPRESQNRAGLGENRPLEPAPPAAPPGDDETLWEYFHRAQLDLQTRDGRSITPVLVFDQFEEAFTLGRADAQSWARVQTFLAELADLVENRPPATLKEKLEQGAPDAERLAEEFEFGSPSCKIVISLREDYLADLEGLKSLMYSVMENRLRITRLACPQAREAVERPAPNLLEAGVADAIVKFVAASSALKNGRDTTGGELAGTTVEPALLSLVCRELNNKRLKSGLPKITADLVAHRGLDVLSEFYQRCMQDIDDTTRTFVEDRLLTKSGYRVGVDLETAVQEHHISRERLELLIKRRLLRLEERQGMQPVIELTHDVLVAPVRVSRDTRQQAEELAQAKATAARARQCAAEIKKRILRAALAGAGLMLLLAYSAWHWHDLSLEATQEREKSQMAQYFSDVSRAENEIDHDNVPQAVNLLKQYDHADSASDQESWKDLEWGYLCWLCQGESRATYRLPANPVPPVVRGVAYSPDGRLLAVAATILPAGQGGAARDYPLVRLLNVVRQTEEAAIAIPGAPGVMAVAFSPDSQFLACATGNRESLPQPGKVYLWSAAAKKFVTTLEGPTRSINSVAFSPDGTWLAAGSEDDSIRLWKLDQQGQMLKVRQVGDKPSDKATRGGVNAVVWSADSSRLAVGFGNGHLQIYAADSASPIADQQVDASGIMSLAFAAVENPQQLLVGTRDGAILTVDSTSPSLTELERRDSQQGVVYSLACPPRPRSSDPWFASAGSNGTIKVWNFAGPRTALASFRGHQDSVYCVAIALDGQQFASGSADGTAKLWDRVLKNGKMVKPDDPALDSQADVRDLAFSSDGTLATALGLPTRRDAADSAAPATGSKIMLWKNLDPDAKDSLSPVELGAGDGKLASAQIVNCVAFSPDGKLLASGDNEGMLVIWDVATRTPIKTKRDIDAVTSVRFSPDGKTLATRYRGQDPRSPSARKGIVKLWSLENSKLWSPENLPVSAEPQSRVLEHPNMVRSLAFSADGKLLATSSFSANSPALGNTGNAEELRTVWLWDVASGTVVDSLGFRSPSTLLDFSPDGKTLAVALNDRSVHLLTIAGGKFEGGKEMGLRGPSAPISSLQFCPDGDILAAGSQDSTVTLWNVKSQEEAVVFRPDAGVVRCLAFKPSEKELHVLAIGGSAGVVKLQYARSSLQPQDLGGDHKGWSHP